MTKIKELAYKKAYVELNELLKYFSKDDLSKIPQELIENIKSNMDNEYIWKPDFSKSWEEQNLMIETKALFIQIYKTYLCPENKKAVWEKYDKICDKLIEEEKMKKYNSNDIFKNNVSISTPKIENVSVESYSQKINNVENQTIENTSMIPYEENIIQKIINTFKEIIRKFFKK